ncbi:transcription elongation factor A N-terminal and central domain-containing protein 2-like [Dreissena polymorpha]|uniref:Transcription elongation factor A N-terminal and central domain-containing protein 2 n=1 Tax=Dreissena polymorpha TaxID=45954 RepID=A0A9D4DHJ3_DREPO|nr:transcription elongation factor A N-terminal and central domain-containing protein 2-like [Dreissena polymorpha]KAH3749058.1 hypothetical protein DPMN_183548 [Dreissena polymorpha]
MDRFVIKNPSPSTASGSMNTSGKPKLKQATIESLKGVVVIDDVLRHKSRLQLATSSKEEKLNSLEQLGKKIPPRHVMMDTKIGKVINKLRKSEDADIRRAAKKVYVKWKTHFVDHIERPMIEVKCDLKTETTRTKARNLLCNALKVENGSELAQAIERETFHEHKRLISNAYKRTIRNLMFVLTNQADIRTKVLAGEITVTDFVKTNTKS